MESMVLRRISVGFLLMSIPLMCFGQFFIWGQDPGALKWSQIQTEHFQVIFPKGYESSGAYVADVLERSYEVGSRSLGHNPRRVPVIIHNKTVVSNGFVSWAPRRMELFTNPPQNNHSHNWLEHLAVHEFRHVVQVDKLNQGATRYLSFLLGEIAPGAVFGLFVPMWFAEGDAVATETGLSHSGRGRLPSFEQGLRAQVLEKGTYSFEKAFFGSFKDYVPNYYELGYQLVASGRVNYGVDIWEKVMTRVGRKPLPLFPFSRSMKKIVGVNETQHYIKTFEGLNTAWRTQNLRGEATSPEIITQPNNLYTDYRYPSFMNDTLLVALKTGFEEIPKVIGIDSKGGEHTLFFPGLINEYGLSSGNGKVVWTELRTDPRWEHRSWSELYIFSLAKGKKSKISRKSRFFAPAVSKDGKKVAVIEVTDKDEYFLVVLDAENGQEIARFSAPDNDFLMTPAWNPDNRTLVAIALDESGKRLVIGDMYAGDLQTVFHAGFVDISKPIFDENGGIIFTGAFSGIDGIYWLDPKTGDVKQMVSSKYGARDAVVQPGSSTLFWSEYTADGYVIAKNSGNLFDGVKPLEKVQDHSLKFHALLREQEGALVTRPFIERKKREIKPFYKLPNLFHLHSWAPVNIDANNMEINPGVVLYFQDVLSTSVVSIGYDHDLNEKVGTFFMDYKYYGWYPVLNLYAGSGQRRSYFKKGDNYYPFYFRENAFKAGLSLPLSFRRYHWYYGINPSFRMSLTKVRATESSHDFFRRNDVGSLEYRFYAYRQQRSVSRDLRPRWAQVIDVNFRHSPMRGADLGNIFSARFIGCFPGILPHHSLRFSVALQQHQEGAPVKQTINYRFSNLINYPRGITGQSNDKVAVFSADYALPLMYPDLNIPYFVYIKRISANLFFDKAFAETKIHPEEGKSYLNKRRLDSFGAELMSHLHILRFIQPVDIGFRMYYLPETRKNGFQVLFGISF